jgi:hypothetical protein
MNDKTLADTHDQYDVMRAITVCVTQQSDLQDKILVHANNLTRMVNRLSQAGQEVVNAYVDSQNVGHRHGWLNEAVEDLRDQLAICHDLSNKPAAQ